MTPTLFLRIASILALIFCAGHTVGGVLSPPAPGVQTDVVQVMKAGSFNAMGAMRTFWDFHVGYGILITVILLVQSIFLAAQHSRQDRCSASAAHSGAVCSPVSGKCPDCYAVFFLGPGLISVAIAACLAVAFYAAGASGSAR